MKIDGNGGNYGANMIQKNAGSSQDSQLKAIQKQIDDTTAKMQKLSENKDMSFEEKTEKRKELQQQLQDLQRQLGQRKIEIQKEAKEKAAPKQDTNNIAKQNKEDETMQAAVYAGHSLEQVKSAYSVKKNLEGRADVLASEIKLDSAGGNNTSLKQEELNRIEEKIETASSKVGKAMTEAQEKLKKTEAEEKKEEDKSEQEKKENAKEREYPPIDISI